MEDFLNFVLIFVTVVMVFRQLYLIGKYIGTIVVNKRVPRLAWTLYAHIGVTSALVAASVVYQW